MPHLVIMDGALKGRRFPLASGTTRIGRVTGNDIVLDNPSVSSDHCEIVMDQTGIHVHDFGSTNGTRVNDLPVKDSPLFRDDTILFGDLPAVLAGDDVPLRPDAAGDEAGMFAPRPAVVVASAAAGQRPAICPPDFKKRRDARLIWTGVIVALLFLIAWAAREFVKSNF